MPTPSAKEARDLSLGVVELGGVETSAFAGASLSDEFMDTALNSINCDQHKGSLALASQVERPDCYQEQVDRAPIAA